MTWHPGATERRTFFRGQEASRFLVLGLFLVTFVPLAIYFGYVRRTPEPPARTAIAQLPPLPPADAGPEFAIVRDDTQRESREDDALELLFKRVRDDKPPGLAASARREITPTDLIVRPKRFRGVPIRIEGYASQVFADDDQDRSIVASGRLYEVWFYQDHDIKKLPCVVYCETVPKSLPGGRDLNERVAVEGYFLKLQKFFGADRKPYHAPLFVGRLVHDPDGGTGRRGEGAAKGKPSIPWIFVPIGLAVLYVGGRLAVLLRNALRPRAPIRRTSAPVDQIDPDDLNRWLEQGAVESPEPDPEDIHPGGPSRRPE